MKTIAVVIIWKVSSSKYPTSIPVGYLLRVAFDNNNDILVGYLLRVAFDNNNGNNNDHTNNKDTNNRLTRTII